MELDKKAFKRLKNKVLKKYPNASTQMTEGGLYFVSDGTDNKLLEEYMIPPQSSVAEAWYWMAETMRVNQNIERTHPNRMDIGTFEKKFNRISQRNRR
jgi:hypothetical protein